MKQKDALSLNSEQNVIIPPPGQALTNEQIFRNIKNNIIRLLDKHRVSIAQLASQTRISELTIQSILNNTNLNPDSYVVYRLAHFFNYDLSIFISHTPDELERLAPTINKFSQPLDKDNFHLAYNKAMGKGVQEIQKLNINELYQWSLNPKKSLKNSNQPLLISNLKSKLTSHPLQHSRQKEFAKLKESIEFIIKSKGMTLEQFARAVDYAPTEMFRLMSGERKSLNLNLIYNISQYLGIEVDTLMKGKKSELLGNISLDLIKVKSSYLEHQYRQNLYFLLNKYGVKLDHLASQLGSSFADIENGTNYFIVRDVAEAFGLPTHILLTANPKSLPKPNVSKLKSAIKKAGKVFGWSTSSLLMAPAVMASGYRVAESDHKLHTALEEATTLSYGLTGGLLGGAIAVGSASVLCGPGAPVCAAVIIASGGLLGGIAGENIGDLLWKTTQSLNKSGCEAKDYKDSKEEVSDYSQEQELDIEYQSEFYGNFMMPQQRRANIKLHKAIMADSPNKIAKALTLGAETLGAIALALGNNKFFALEALLKRGLGNNFRDEKREKINRVLYEAICQENEELISQALEQGANTYGLLDFAIFRGKSKAVDILQKHGLEPISDAAIYLLNNLSKQSAASFSSPHDSQEKPSAAPENHKSNFLIDSMHTLAETTTRAHLSHVHLPSKLQAAGLACEFGAKICHHHSENLVEKIVCGTGVAFAKEVVNYGIASLVAAPESIAASAVTSPIGGAIVAGTIGHYAYEAANQITQPIADAISHSCHAHFENMQESMAQLKLNAGASMGNIQMMAAALMAKADVNFIDDSPYQFTALHWAAMKGEVAAVNFLLSHGANVTIKDKEGRTPLDLARAHFKSDIVDRLEEAELSVQEQEVQEVEIPETEPQTQELEDHQQVEIQEPEAQVLEIPDLQLQGSQGNLLKKAEAIPPTSPGVQSKAFFQQPQTAVTQLPNLKTPASTTSIEKPIHRLPAISNSPVLDYPEGRAIRQSEKNEPQRQNTQRSSGAKQDSKEHQGVSLKNHSVEKYPKNADKIKTDFTLKPAVKSHPPEKPLIQTKSTKNSQQSQNKSTKTLSKSDKKDKAQQALDLAIEVKVIPPRQVLSVRNSIKLDCFENKTPVLAGFNGHWQFFVSKRIGELLGIDKSHHIAAAENSLLIPKGTYCRVSGEKDEFKPITDFIPKNGNTYLKVSNNYYKVAGNNYQKADNVEFKSLPSTAPEKSAAFAQGITVNYSWKSIAEVGYPANFINREFRSSLANAGLTDIYNNLHQWNRSFSTSNWSASYPRSIGGIAAHTGQIKGLKNSAFHALFDQHIFCLEQEGETFFTSKDLQQFLPELAVGMLIKGAAPFVSLHQHALFDTADNDFNPASLYSVLHPAYQRTLIGETIGLFDYFMKGFVNGAIFNKDVLESWTVNNNLAFLNDKLLNLKNLFKKEKHHYRSLREKMCRIGLEKPQNSTTDIKSLFSHKFFASFRIESKQKHIFRHDNLFLINPEMVIYYDIHLKPEFQAEVEAYQALHGTYPPTYYQLHLLFEETCKEIKTQMPKLALFQYYFNLLGIINFFCYYLPTLREMNKTIELMPPLPHTFTFPSSLPAIPVRYYQTYPLKITLGEVLKELDLTGSSMLKKFMRDCIDFPKKLIPAALNSALTSTFYALLIAKVPNQLLSEEDLAENIEKLLASFKKLIKEFLVKSKKNWHQAIKKFINYYHLDFSFKKITAIKTFKAKLQCLEQAVQEELLEQYKAANIWIKKLEVEIESLSSFFINKNYGDIALIDTVNQSTLLIPENKNNQGKNFKVVGGCQMDLSPLKQENLLNGQTLLKICASVLERENDATVCEVVHDDKRYAAFKLNTKDYFAEEILANRSLLDSTIQPDPKIGEAELKAINFLSQSSALEEAILLPPFNPRARDNGGQTILHYLSYFGTEQQLSALVKDDLSLLTMADNAGNLPIHAAAIAGNAAALHYFMHKNPKLIYCKNKQGYTSLLLAAESGRMALVSLLLERPTDINERLENGLCALGLSIQNKQSDTALLILQQAKHLNVNRILATGQSFLHLAIEMQQEAVALALIEKGINLHLKQLSDGYSAYFCAVVRNQVKICRALLNTGMIDINEQHISGKTTVWLAAVEGHFALLRLLYEDFQADINHPHVNGDTPIMAALKAGQTEVALYLAGYVKLNQVNQQRQTACVLAAALGQFAVADVLIQRGEDFRQKDQFGHDYVYHLLVSGEYSRYKALSKQYALNFDDTYQGLSSLDLAAKHAHPLLIDFLLDKKVNFTLDQTGDWKLIHFAVKANHLSYLLQWLENPENLRDLNRLYTLSGIAGENGHITSLQTLLKYVPMPISNALLLTAALRGAHKKVLNIILNKYVDVNQGLDEQQNTAGHFAAQYGLTSLLPFLQAHGVDFRLKNAEGQSAFHVAILQDYPYLLKKLLKLFPAQDWPEDLLSFAIINHKPSCIKLLSKHFSPAASSTQLMQPSDKNSVTNSDTAKNKAHLIHALQEVDEESFLFYLKLLDIDKETFVYANCSLPLLHLIFKLEAEWAIPLLLSQGADPFVKDEHGHNIFQFIVLSKESKYSRQLALLDEHLITYKKGLLREESKQHISVFSLAIKHQHLWVIEPYLSLKETKTYQNARGDSLLHIAVRTGNQKILAVLLEKGFEVNLKNNQERTALMIAAQGGNSAIIQLLLAYGAEVNEQDIYRQTGLHYAIQQKHTDAALLLMPLMKRLHLKNAKGNTPFMLAASKGLVLIMQAIVARESACYVTNHQGWNALHLAAMFGQTEAVLYLLTLNFSLQDRNPRYPSLNAINIAAKNGHIETCLALAARCLRFSTEEARILSEQLIASQHPKTIPCLQALHIPLISYHVLIAAEQGNLQVLKHCYQQGLDINLLNTQGQTALHLAAKNGHEKVVAFLIHHQVMVETIDQEGNTALHHAAISGSIAIIRQLYAKNLSLDQPNFSGKTPLYLACEMGQYAAVLELLKYHASFHIDCEETTPAQIALKHKHFAIAKLLTVLGDRSLAYAALAAKPQSMQKSLEPCTEEIKVINAAIDACKDSKDCPLNLIALFNLTDGIYLLEQRSKKLSYCLPYLEFEIPDQIEKVFEEPSLPNSSILQHASPSLETSPILNLEALYNINSYAHFKSQAKHFFQERSTDASRKFMEKFFGTLDAVKAKDLNQEEKLVLAKLYARHLYLKTPKVDSDRLIFWSVLIKNNLGSRYFYKLLDLVSKVAGEFPLYLTSAALLIDLAPGIDVEEILNSSSSLEVLIAKLRTEQHRQWTAQFPEKNLDAVIQAFSAQNFPLSARELQKLKEDYLIIQSYRASYAEKDLDELALEAKKYGPNLSKADSLKLIALMREVMKKIYKVYPYHTQILTVLVFINSSEARGYLGQVRTGEGKSMIIAFLAAIEAVRGEVVDILTTSRYLAIRDCEKYQPFYAILGQSVSHICYDEPQKEHFNAKIIYATDSDQKFSLLRALYHQQDVRYTHINGKLQKRPFSVVISEEADSFMIDTARSSARLAIASLCQISWIYEPIFHFVKNLGESFENNDYCEELRLNLLNYQDGRYQEQIHQLSNYQLKIWLHSAYKACVHLAPQKDYILRPNPHNPTLQEVVLIVDFEHTGRVSTNGHWSQGLHEFIELKHGLQPTEESLTLTAISHADFMQLYKKVYCLSGTCGNADERQLIQVIHGLKTFDVPAYFGNQAHIEKPEIFLNQSLRFQASYEKMQQAVSAGRPVLILVDSIAASLAFSAFLDKQQLKHQLLNEIQVENEVYIIERAGLPGMVTVATNIAGRGTDIPLTPSAKEAGGLLVIVTFYPANNRVLEQAYGRTKRNNAPGSCCMVISCDDALIQKLIPSEMQRSALINDSNFIERLDRLREAYNQTQQKQILGHTQLQGIYFKLSKHFSEGLGLFAEQLQAFPDSKITAFLKKIVTEERVGEAPYAPQLYQLQQQAQHFLLQQRNGVTIDWLSFLQQLKERYCHLIQQRWAVFYSALEDYQEGLLQQDILKVQENIQKLFYEFIQEEMSTDLKNPALGFLHFISIVFQTDCNQLLEDVDDKDTTVFTAWLNKLKAPTESPVNRFRLFSSIPQSPEFSVIKQKNFTLDI